MSHIQSPATTLSTHSTSILVNTAICTVLLIVLNKTHVLFNSLGSDAGVFLLGADLLNQGLIPYADFWTNKPPGIFLILSLAYQTSLPPILAAALLETLATLVAALLLFILLRSLIPQVSAALGTLAAIVIVTSDRFNDAGILPESYLVLLEIATAACLVGALRARTSTQVMLSAATGLLGWVCFLMKPVGIGPLLSAYVSLIIFLLFMERRRSTLIMLGTMSIGMGLAVTVTLAFQTAYSSFHDMLYAAVGYNLHYATTGMSRAGGLLPHIIAAARVIKWSLLLFPIITITNPIVIRMLDLRKDKTNEILTFQEQVLVFLLLWAGADLCGAMLSGYAYAHYFQPMQIPLFLSAVIGLHIYRQNIPSAVLTTCYVLISISTLGNGIESLLFLFRRVGRAPAETIALLVQNPSIDSVSLHTLGSSLAVGISMLVILTIAALCFLGWNISRKLQSYRLVFTSAVTILVGLSGYILAPQARSMFDALTSERRTAILDQAAWIDSSISPERPILVWGHSMELYHQTRRRPSQQLLTTIHLTEVQGEPLYRMTSRVLADLQNNPPAIIIDRTHKSSLIPSIHCNFSGNYTRDLEHIMTFICTEYRRKQLTDGSRIYFEKRFNEETIGTFPAIAH